MVPFGVRRLVAAFTGRMQHPTGGLPPGYPPYASNQAGIFPKTGSKLPVPGQQTIRAAATSRRTPDGFGAMIN